MSTIQFKLKKNYNKWKAGETFDSFGGLVRGIGGDSDYYGLKFDDPEWFEVVKVGKKDATGEYMNDYDDVTLLGCSQVTERLVHFAQKADDEFFETNNGQAGYYLVVVEKYLNELKNRVIHSAI